MGRALARADEAHAALAVDAIRKEGVTILEGHKAARVSGGPGNVGYGEWLGKDREK